MCLSQMISTFFFFNDTATTEIYTLSLHDALPISAGAFARRDIQCSRLSIRLCRFRPLGRKVDRKSTRLNSSHSQISYAVFCLKKKNNDANLFFRFTLELHEHHLLQLHYFHSYIPY